MKELSIKIGNQIDRWNKKLVALCHLSREEVFFSSLFPIRYYRLGSGEKKLLVLHGFADQAESFLFLVGKLAKEYEIIVPCLPGFDERFSLSPFEYSFENMALSLLELTKERRFNQFHLLGHSIGGALCLKIHSLSAKNIQSIGLFNSAGLDLKSVPSIIDQIRAGENPFLIKTKAELEQLQALLIVKPNFFIDRLSDWLVSFFSRNSTRYIRVASDLFREFEEFEKQDIQIVELSQVECPVFIIWGTEDRFFPLALGEEYKKRISNSRLFLIKETGHCPHYEKPFEVKSLLNSLYL